MNPLRALIQEEGKMASFGKEMHALMTELYPIPRSLTGHGVRKTLEILRNHVPLDVHEVPTGTAVFDWVIPKEWNIRDAYILDPEGRKIVDFQKSNLHVVSYSIPVKKKMSLAELKPHLHTLPDQPEAIPYLTTYYKEDWGFCLSHRQYAQLKEGDYEICIDATFEKGSLTYGDYFLKGKESEEVLLSCYTCHPSLCNDNLSGVVLTTFLAKVLSQMNLRYSYRFLFVPETIGAIAWLCLNEERVSRIKHGLVVTCVGDPGPSTYKRSLQSDALIDRAAVHVLKHSGAPYQVIDFYPNSDERQFCSPAFNLPVGSLMRTPYGHYPEYHTSLDDLELVRAESLADSFLKYLSVFDILENNQTYLNQNPKCEPMLGKRGLYPSLGAKKTPEKFTVALLCALNFSNGRHTLLDISERTGLAFGLIQEAAEALQEKGLLKEIHPEYHESIFLETSQDAKGS